MELLLDCLGHLAGKKFTAFVGLAKASFQSKVFFPDPLDFVLFRKAVSFLNVELVLDELCLELNFMQLLHNLLLVVCAS